ncbi:hypothetical protein EZS27_011617 [termite gut metagenome]|uniref:Uncharacterized protein n=1 Tax=termite gut metagenome TaxID=433724 RepID=A0A5J4S5L3_9ZZZZ
MIYLFEDRKGRMNQFYNKSIDSNNLKEAIFDCTKDELERYVSENFPDAKAILFHRSYTFPKHNITNEDVKSFFVEKKIPFVFFSGGLSNNLYEENGIVLGDVNSGDMYKNLDLFLDELKLKRRINIPLLVYGKEYLINSLLAFQHRVMLYFVDKNNTDILAKSSIEEIIEITKEELKGDDFTIDKEKNKEKILDWLKKSINNSNSISIGTLYIQIQKMINNY